MRTDTITVKTPSGRIKTKYKRTCAYCNAEFYSWRRTSLCCSQSHYLRFAYDTNLRDRKSIALNANKASREKGYDYRIGNPIYGVIGEKHHAWKGGVSNKNNNLRKSAKYKQWRMLVFERDKYTCVWCGAKNYKGLGKTVELNADHIKPFSIYPELRFELSNGRTLCHDCHSKTDTYGNSKKTRVIDE